jgi:hypothetical protein
MRILLVALWGAVWTGTAAADIIVDPPQPLTRRVTVQLIQTALDDGSSPATAFGNTTQRADIEANIDSIWAQAGIDIAILPTINRYNDTFAYQGNAGSGERPGSDLSTIFNNARNEGGILNPDPLVLNLVFANVVPAFPPFGEGTTAGYARVDGNGIIGYVGDNLLEPHSDRDIVASVMAHEIGHNLGLNHIGSNQPNLMSPSGDTEQLNSSQIAEARSSNFARLIPAVLTGDYNRDGTVTAADFVVWRKTLNQVATGLLADGNNNGRIDDADYTVWRIHFGESGSAGIAVGMTDAGLISVAAVPEPSSGCLALFAMLSLARTLRRKRRCANGRSC